MNTSNSMRAVEFTGKKPHFIMWTVKGSGCTWCASYPVDRLPFRLESVWGAVDETGAFRATNVGLIIKDALSLKIVDTIVIEPDVESSAADEESRVRAEKPSVG
jgi:hypothetical protein